MEEEEKELVWLPKNLAKKIKENTDKALEEKLILEYLDESREDIKLNLQSLEEDVLVYKGLMAKARQAFREAKEEQLKANYEMWEEFEKELPKFSEKIESLKSLIEPVKQQVEEIRELLKEIKMYEIEDLLETIKEIEYALSSNRETGKILRFLFKNYKKDTK